MDPEEEGVRVVRMDALSPAQTDMVERLFHGDGTCSLGNMEVACFASERCSRPNATGTGPRTMSGAAKNTYVTLRGDDVVAFASMIPMAHSRFLNLTHPPREGVLLSNLCVRAGDRSHGHGRRMLEYLVARSSAPVYVAVRRPDPQAPKETQAFMQSRSEGLLRTYRKWSFETVEDTTHFHVLRHKV